MGKQWQQSRSLKAKFLIFPEGQQLPADPDCDAADFQTVDSAIQLPQDTSLVQLLKPGVSNFDFLSVCHPSPGPSRQVSPSPRRPVLRGPAPSREATVAVSPPFLIPAVNLVYTLSESEQFSLPFYYASVIGSVG